MELDQSFKERMRWALEFRDPPCSQSELARAVGMSPQAIQQWISGATSNPRRDKLQQAADHLGVRFDWLAYARGPMRTPDAQAPTAPGPALPTDVSLRSREWEEAMIAALPPEAHAHLQVKVAHPNGLSRFRVDYLSKGMLVMIGLYRSAAGVIEARKKCWQLLVAREITGFDPDRRTVLLLSPLEEWLDVPERHIEALRSEAKLLGIEVLHARDPVESAAVLVGKLENPALPVEDDLGLESSPVL